MTAHLRLVHGTRPADSDMARILDPRPQQSGPRTVSGRAWFAALDTACTGLGRSDDWAPPHGIPRPDGVA